MSKDAVHGWTTVDRPLRKTLTFEDKGEWIAATQTLRVETTQATEEGGRVKRPICAGFVASLANFPVNAPRVHREIWIAGGDERR